MKQLFFAFAVSLLMVGTVHAHGNISNLPDSVQVLQYRMLLYMDPGNNATRNKLAMALYRTGKLDEAKTELGTILKNDPADFDALDGMGIVLLKSGNYQQALQYLEKAQSLRDKDVMVHVHLSAVYDKLGRKDKAAAELARARELATTPAMKQKIDKELQLIAGP